MVGIYLSFHLKRFQLSSINKTLGTKQSAFNKTLVNSDTGHDKNSLRDAVKDFIFSRDTGSIPPIEDPFKGRLP